MSAPDNLYEILGVERDATEEQIRKAYKRRALQTHPDRVPPDQKIPAEDEFRKVSNAYEVLRDVNKRHAYDSAGVWPPPPPGSGGSYYRHRGPRPSREPRVPFPEDPFDLGDLGGWPFHAGFTDPFLLFQSIFGDLHHGMSDPFFPDPWGVNRRHDQRGRAGFFDDPLVDMGFPFDRHGGFDDMINPGNGRVRVYSQVTRGSRGPDGRWVAESRTTRTVNGVTESVWKRRDGVGNEYATYTYPDGREWNTVNGHEQIDPQQQPQQHAPSQHIRGSPTPPPLLPPPPIQTNSLPPPPYPNPSRKRESPTSISGRSRDTTGREHHFEIQNSHAGSPPPQPPPPVPPINHSYGHGHHYRQPPLPPVSSHYRGTVPTNMPAPVVHDRSYERPHYKSRRWK